MSSLKELPWRFLPAVRRTERGRFAFFCLLNFVISGAQTVGLAGSEALFLAELGPEKLPIAFILASVATVAGSLLYAVLVGRFRNDVLMMAMLLLFSAALSGAALLLWQGASWILLPLYCAFFLGQAIFVNLHFWTFAADFFDTLAAKRLFPLFAVGSSLGGVLGGTLSAVFSEALPTESLVLVWAAGLLLVAAVTHLASDPLKRWTPLDQDEADESSVESIRSAVRFLGRNPLALGLVFSVVGMVFALFLLQYLYMEIFAESFHSPAALASFFGIYLAVSNAVELFVGHSVTPWLIRRLGVAQANLVHPLLTLLTFGALFFDPRLHTAILARANRELLSDSLASPIRTLTFNALPFRFRGRLRALVEGIVYFGAMSIAGGALLLVGRNVDAIWLILAGVGAAILYAIANLIVRREYLRSLLAELRSGRLHLDDVGAELGSGDIAGLAARWEDLLHEEGERPSDAVLELAPLLARGGFIEPLERSLEHAHPRVRIACLTALARVPHARFDDELDRALADPDVSVRLAAVALCDSGHALPTSLARGLEQQLDHADPRLRAAAARALGPAGESTLRRMARSADEDEAVAALERLGATLSDEAVSLLESESAAVRAAALDAATRLLSPHPLSGEALARELRHPEWPVRAAAARALGAGRAEDQAEALGEALDDVARSVRAEAAHALAGLGPAGSRATRAALMSLRRWTADAAIRTLELSNSEHARALLAVGLRERASLAWHTKASLHLLPPEDHSLPARFLRSTLENTLSCHVWVAFRMLESRESPRVVRSVQKALGSGPARQRSDALELLSNLGDRVSSQQLALLLEDGPLEETLPQIAAVIDLPKSFDEVLLSAETSDDRWLELAAQGFSAMRAGTTHPQEATMESLLALRSVSLFSNLSFEQLEAIKRLMREAQYMRGEVLIAEGEMGDDLFVLMEGEARAYKNWGSEDPLYLSTFTPVSYFGEIAVLDSAPRSATVVATKDCRLLTLEGDRLKELVLQAPEISFEIFRVLTARIRAAEAR